MCYMDELHEFVTWICARNAVRCDMLIILALLSEAIASWRCNTMRIRDSCVASS